VDQHSHCLSGAPSTVTGHTSRVSWGICIVRTRGGIGRLYGAYVLVSMSMYVWNERQVQMYVLERSPTSVFCVTPSVVQCRVLPSSAAAAGFVLTRASEALHRCNLLHMIG